MRQPHRGEDLYRRTLAIACAVVALVSTACGSPVAGASNPTPGPVTADSIRAALGNSTMANGHFVMHGTIIKSRVYYPVSGEGILQLTPREALQMTTRIQTYATGVFKMQEVTIGGFLYTRIGSGRWTSKPSSSSLIAITSYVGEEISDGAAVWHARSTAASTTYDVWIRESDGYIVRIVYANKTGKVTMTFDSYNLNREIAAPKN
jgi:hypothetical protein